MKCDIMIRLVTRYIFPHVNTINDSCHWADEGAVGKLSAESSESVPDFIDYFINLDNADVFYKPQTDQQLRQTQREPEETDLLQIHHFFGIWNFVFIILSRRLSQAQTDRLSPNTLVYLQH